MPCKLFNVAGFCPLHANSNSTPPPQNLDTAHVSWAEDCLPLSHTPLSAHLSTRRVYMCVSVCTCVSKEPLWIRLPKPRLTQGQEGK